jgi:thiol-disulfide isomerase/thioredoxin
VRQGPRVRAPELRGRGGWLNTGGQPLSLAQLRGRFVLLDFWTFACANCLHVIDELRALERDYADVLVVVGVHSPKFAHEGLHPAVAAAIQRYGVQHPVLDDPDLAMWGQYAVRAWPTLVLIDPAGYVVAQAAGEGHASGLARIIDELIPTFEAAGTLRRGSGPYVAPRLDETLLRFPAKAILLPHARTGRTADSLLVANAGSHSLAELGTDTVTLLRRIGSGARGRADGPAEQATFAEPGGLTLLPLEVAERVGFDVVVADTANHLLRGVRLGDGAVVATAELAAALVDARTITGAVPGVLSPWDVVWWPTRQCVVVAAAGVHLLLSWSPDTGAVEILAGTTVEGLRDGPALDGWLAQPSGLAVDGERLWFVDAETSSLRYLADGQLHTAVGEGLFDFGLVDGPAAQARLQHPLGLTVLGDRSIAVLDTYNGAVRRYDPVTDEMSTLASGLEEPSGAVLVGGELVVVESGAHRLARPVLAPSTSRADPMPVQRPVTELAAGAVELEIVFEVPPGRKLDDSTGADGSPIRVSVTASPSSLLLSGGGDSLSLRRTLTLAPDAAGVLSVTAQGATCDDSGAEHPACYLSRQDWGVPIRIVSGGAAELRLMLLG